MNTNHNKLALRKQSIRTLTADELRIAHGGDGGNGTGTTARAPTPRTPPCPPPGPTRGKRWGRRI